MVTKDDINHLSNTIENSKDISILKQRFDSHLVEMKDLYKVTSKEINEKLDKVSEAIFDMKLDQEKRERKIEVDQVKQEVRTIDRIAKSSMWGTIGGGIVIAIEKLLHIKIGQ